MTMTTYDVTNTLRAQTLSNHIHSLHKKASILSFSILLAMVGVDTGPDQLGTFAISSRDRLSRRNYHDTLSLFLYFLSNVGHTTSRHVGRLTCGNVIFSDVMQAFTGSKL